MDGQTRTRGPVERLEREVGAGGRRRARGKEDKHAQRAEREKRPEEARAQRKEANTGLRRNAKTTERQRHGAHTNGPKNFANSPAPTGTAAHPVSFQAQLSSKGSAQTSTNSPSALKSSAGSSSEPAGVVLAAVNNPIQALSTAVLGLGTAATASASSAVASGAGQNSGSGNGADTQAAAVPGVTAKHAKQTAAAGSLPDTSSALREQSEAQEAQRSTQVLRQLRMQLHPGMRSVSIQLAPAHLGRLSIRMHVDAGEVHAIVRAENEDTLAVLERHIPELEAAFGDQGFEGMSFEFVLDREGSRDTQEWRAGSDVSNQLEALIEDKLNPDLRGSQTLTDIEVDTYA